MSALLENNAMVGYGLAPQGSAGLLPSFGRPGLRSLARFCSWCASALPVGDACRHSINREVLLAMTAGRLLLCDQAEIQAFAKGSPVLETLITGPDCLQSMRDGLKSVIDRCIDPDRMSDLLTCATEAATNSLKYAGDATVRAWLRPQGVRVLISDCGGGIPPTVLTRATLESGFSTRNTLGMGFTLMLAMADRLALCTTPRGTDVLIEIHGLG